MWNFVLLFITELLTMATIILIVKVTTMVEARNAFVLMHFMILRVAVSYFIVARPEAFT